MWSSQQSPAQWLACAREVGIQHRYADLNSVWAAQLLRGLGAGNQQELPFQLCQSDAGDHLNPKHSQWTLFHVNADALT